MLKLYISATRQAEKRSYKNIQDNRRGKQVTILQNPQEDIFKAKTLLNYKCGDKNQIF